VRTLDELLTEAPTFTGIAAGHLELIAGCARNRVYDDGSFLLREGEVDDAFFVVRRGGVALEIAAPTGAITVETLEEHDVVGWSWVLPPYRSHFDARAVGETHVIEFDATCLRGKCEEDAVLGYELYKRFAAIIVERLQATRLRLLDVYGSVAGV
jgi:CRP/FNR family transcriptional regulator, cyclic AMP receptor protein